MRHGTDKKGNDMTVCLCGRMWPRKLVATVATGIVVAAAPLCAWAEETPAKPATSSVVLLKTTTTGDDVPLAYPAGTPQILSRVTTFPPGAETPLHRHPVPLYGYILEGELTIYPEGGEPKRLKTGDAFMENANWHMGRNETDKPVRLLAVYMGYDGFVLSELKK